MATSALRFTPLGAVSAPETVQLRIAPAFAGRVPLGAPVASRALTPAEVDANVDHFRDPGPRHRAVRRVVLSGLPEAWLAAEVAARVAHMAEQGVERAVLHLHPAHAGRVRPGGLVLPTDVAVAVRSVGDVARLPPGLRVTVPLTASVVGDLAAIVEALPRIEPAGVTLLWPYPSGAVEPPPGVASIVGALTALGSALRELPWGIKGLPLCTLLPLSARLGLRERVWQSANRFYVDADHQQGEALLLRPDLVRLTKVDSCRFCKVERQCEGVAAEWLEAGLTGGLHPIEDEKVL